MEPKKIEKNHRILQVKNQTIQVRNPEKKNPTSQVPEIENLQVLRKKSLLLNLSKKNKKRRVTHQLCKKLRLLKRLKNLQNLKLRFKGNNKQIRLLDQQKLLPLLLRKGRIGRRKRSKKNKRKQMKQRNQ